MPNLSKTDSVRIGISFESKGAVKSYPLAHRTVLLRELVSLGSQVTLFGIEDQTPRSFDMEGLIDFRGRTTIDEMASLIEQMDLFVGVDSFAVHLANVLEVPTLVLLSTTAGSSFQWHQHVSCLASGVECAPCFAVHDTCPLGSEACQAFDHKSISPHVILGHVQKQLASVFLQKLRQTSPQA